MSKEIKVQNLKIVRQKQGKLKLDPLVRGSQIGLKKGDLSEHGKNIQGKLNKSVDFNMKLKEVKEKASQAQFYKKEKISDVSFPSSESPIYDKSQEEP